MDGSRSIALIAGAVLMLTASFPVGAQIVAKPTAAAKPAAAQGETKAAEAAKAFAAGTAAFENSKTDAAISALSAAISTGGLKNPELAKAMFYRGVAYRTQKKPAAALSDLNAAVWLRNGLSPADKAVAEDHRQALLREVSALNGTPPVLAPAPVATAGPSAAAVAEAAPAAATSTAAPEAASPNAASLPWQTADASVAATPKPAPPVAQTMEQAAPAATEVMPWLTASADGAVRPQQREVQAGAPARTQDVMPWTVAPEERAAPAQPDGATAQRAEPVDTISEPVASVAPVERATLTTVHTEAAPPEKLLPWQTAARERAEPSVPRADAATPPPSPTPAVQTAAVKPTVPAAAPIAAGFVSDSPTQAPGTSAGVPAAQADAGKAAQSFLGTLFTGSGQTPAAAPIETAALPERAMAAEPQPSVRTAETAAAPAEPVQPDAPGIKTAAADTAAEPTPIVAVFPGPYRLQIAAENSRADAEKTAARLIEEHKPSLRGLDPVIEEPATGPILFGSMGAAYRVSLGPYSSSMEPGRLCNILKPHGFDCRVVAAP